MTVTVYRSTDSSAPQLNGQVGSLIALFDAVLVNGYGAKAAQGWTKEFTGTNAAVYRAPTGNRHYLDVDDNNAGAGSAYWAKVRGYETMSAVATGTGPFPTVAQMANAYWMKSEEGVNTTTVLWIIVGNGTLFHMWTRLQAAHVQAPAGDWGHYVGCFGEINTFRVGDTYHSMIIAQGTNSSMSSNGITLNLATTIGSVNQGNYMARSFTGAGASINVGKHSDYGKTGSTAVIGSSGMTYPNGPDNGLYLAPVWVHEASTQGLRGMLPGLWAPLHNRPLVTYDTFNGTGNLAGKSFLALQTRDSSTYGQIFFETSNTW